MRPRTCPTHRYPMQRLTTTSPAGRELEIDRCGECGALWFDAGELELLATHRALPAGPGFEHFCPSCSDPAAQPDLKGDFAAVRCTQCLGTFLDAATVVQLKRDRLPQPPEAHRPREVGFRCARCEGRFPYAEGTITAGGLTCRACLKHAAGADSAAILATTQELTAAFDAVLGYLSVVTGVREP